MLALRCFGDPQFGVNYVGSQHITALLTVEQFWVSVQYDMMSKPNFVLATMFHHPLLKAEKKGDISEEKPLLNSDDPSEAFPLDSKTPGTKSAETIRQEASAIAVTSENPLGKQQQQLQQQPASSLENNLDAASGAAVPGKTQAVATFAALARGDDSKNPHTAAVPALVKVGAVLVALIVAVVFMLPHCNGMAKVVSFERNITVAFVGSSLLYVNDIPRLVEAISGQHVVQNSCLHAKGSLLSILETGNGLYFRWRTDKAILEQNLMSNGRLSTIYDLGACTVPQLLFGHDHDLSYANQNGLYYNDGTNPCMKDDMYYRYTKRLNATDWNFAVLNEQTEHMAVSNDRSSTLITMVNYYAPLLKNMSAIPIIVQPYAYWSDRSNMTGWSDVTTFTFLIYEGTEEYAVALKDQLPSSQTPRVAPVGLAFLVVYEENHDLWEQLFSSDGIQASLFGSYVIGLSLYATMYGQMPPKTYALIENMEMLWSKARKLQEGGGYPSSSDYPTTDEAAYLYDVVERVNIQKYKPSTLNYNS